MTIPRDVDLLPCPFCGGTRTECVKDGIARPWVAGCGTCRVWVEADTKAKAIAIWNKRFSLSADGGEGAVRDGSFPAFLTMSQAWPQGYVYGWNDALKIAREEGFGPRLTADDLSMFPTPTAEATAAHAAWSEEVVTTESVGRLYGFKPATAAHADEGDALSKGERTFVEQWRAIGHDPLRDSHDVVANRNTVCQFVRLIDRLAAPQAPVVAQGGDVEALRTLLFAVRDGTMPTPITATQATSALLAAIARITTTEGPAKPQEAATLRTRVENVANNLGEALEGCDDRASAVAAITPYIDELFAIAGTPQPLAVSDAMVGLVAKWRAIAAEIRSSWNSPNGHGDSSRRVTYKHCADELERLINPAGVGGTDHG
jgi:hypothetical protein